MFEAKISHIKKHQLGVTIFMRLYDTEIKKVKKIDVVDGIEKDFDEYERVLLEQYSYTLPKGSTNTQIVDDLKLKMKNKTTKEKLKYTDEGIYVAL